MSTTLYTPVGRGRILVFEVKGDSLPMELFRMSRRAVVRKTEPFKVFKRKILSILAGSI